jgi:hypothetical protein
MLILMFPRVQRWNRWRLLMRKVNGEASLTRWCSKCLNLHFAIDDLALDSRDLARLWHGSCETVPQLHL